MARVNIFRQVLTEKGWRNAALDRDEKGRIKWPSRARFLIEWRESGRRKREAAGETPSEAQEAQRRKRLELEAKATGLNVTDPEEEAKAEALPLTQTIDGFLKDIKIFRKKLTWQKYDHILNLFAEYVAPKSDARDITAEDVKKFLAWRKSKGYDPGTTLYTDRVPLEVETEFTKFYAISFWHEREDMEKYTKEHFPKVKAMVEPFLTAPIIVKHCKVDETIPKKFVTAVAA